MIYAEETRKKLDAILKAFGDYIEEQDYFDVVYSPKAGYVKFKVEDVVDEDMVMDTPETLLENLFYEIINDVIFSPDNPKQEHDDLLLTEYEETESRRRITEILEKMDDGDKAQYLALLDTYIKKFQEDAVS